MSATPLIPGRLYRVRGAGIDLQVIASHPCEAILIGLRIRFIHPPTDLLTQE